MWEGRIAYTAETAQGRQLFILDANSMEPRALVQGHSPAWSPGGERIVFVSERVGTPQLYLTDAAGQSITQLTRTLSVKSAPAWSPRGDWIAMLARDGGGQRLQVVDVRGITERILSGSAVTGVESFAWAPDGQELLFDAPASGRSAIWRVPLDGLTAQRFVRINGRQPVYSPDGQRVSFAGEDGIYVVDRSGANLKRLTTITAAQPRWSPDGSRVLFLVEGGAAGRAPDLWVMNADGTEQKRVGGANCRAALWAGRQDFAFCITDGGMDGGPAMRVLGLDLLTGATFPVAGLSESALSWTR